MVEQLLLGLLRSTELRPWSRRRIRKSASIHERLRPAVSTSCPTVFERLRNDVILSGHKLLFLLTSSTTTTITIVVMRHVRVRDCRVDLMLMVTSHLFHEGVEELLPLVAT